MFYWPFPLPLSLLMQPPSTKKRKLDGSDVIATGMTVYCTVCVMLQVPRPLELPSGLACLLHKKQQQVLPIFNLPAGSSHTTMCYKKF